MALLAQGSTHTGGAHPTTWGSPVLSWWNGLCCASFHVGLPPGPPRPEPKGQREELRLGVGEGSSEPLAKRKGRKSQGGGRGRTGSAQAQSSDGISAWDQRSYVPDPWCPPLMRCSDSPPTPRPWAYASLAMAGSGSLVALELLAPNSGWAVFLVTSLPSLRPNQLVLSGPAFYLNAELCPFSVPGGSSWLGPGAPVPHTAPSWCLLEGALGSPPCTPQAPPCSQGTRGSAQQLLFCQLPSCS